MCEAVRALPPLSIFGDETLLRSGFFFVERFGKEKC